MQFDLVTIFPSILDSYFQYAQLKRALDKKIIEINTHDIRDYTHDKHKTVDDVPYGGGAGMIMKVEPIYECIEDILAKSKIARKDTRIILLSAKGKIFDQKKAQEFAKYKKIVLISGRYEGVDERVAKNICDEEISIGKFIISGGELGSGIVMDAVTRLLPGVLGNTQSLAEESYNSKNLEYPQYTRPEKFKGWKVPKVLLSGNHKLISSWRKKNS